MIRRPPRSTLFPLHDALPICAERLVQKQHLRIDRERARKRHALALAARELRRVPLREALQLHELKQDRKSTRLNSSHANISYAVFCLKKKNKTQQNILMQLR